MTNNDFRLMTYLLLLACCSFTCNRAVQSEGAAGGTVKTRRVNGVELSVGYLSPSYLARKEMQDAGLQNAGMQDSLEAAYGKALSFLLTIAPDEEKRPGADVTFMGVTSMKDYKQRIHEMNFEMDQYVTLLAGDQEYRPVLTAMENVQGITPKRSIILVFAPHEAGDLEFYGSRELTVVYNDGLFGAGRNVFRFEREEMEVVGPDSYRGQRQ